MLNLSSLISNKNNGDLAIDFEYTPAQSSSTAYKRDSGLSDVSLKQPLLPLSSNQAVEPRVNIIP